MEAYQQRVVTERDELEAKRIALMKFTISDQFKSVALPEQDRLFRQLGTMTAYVFVLNDRILHF